MNEVQIKTKLAQYLLRESEYETILGAEVQFSFSSRRADLISISDGMVTAYEIKSLGDKLSRLPEQLSSYREFFDYCYVVCEPESLSSVRQIVGYQYGILVIGENIVEVVRKPRIFKRHKKKILASILSVAELKDITGRNDFRSKFQLCEYAAKAFTTDALYHFSREKLIKRYKISTSLLKKETLSLISADDIQTLTIVPPTELVLHS